MGEKGSSSFEILVEDGGKPGWDERSGEMVYAFAGGLRLGMTIVKSSAAFVGLKCGWATSGGRVLSGRPNCFAWALPFTILPVDAGLSTFLCEGFTELAVGAGVLTLFTGLTAGLLGGVSVFVNFLGACGSAVAGLGGSALRRGRTGAEDKVPTEVVDTLREAVDMKVAGLPRFIWEADFFGELKGSADPGREGRFLPAAFTALF